MKTMSKNNQNPFATSLKKVAYGQSISFSRNDRNDVTAEVKRFNRERNPYQFTQSNNKNGTISVTRVIPTNLYDRKLYIDGITKSQLTTALRSNEWSKEATAREFGISARSIGRMISKLNVVRSAKKTAKKAK